MVLHIEIPQHVDPRDYCAGYWEAYSAERPPPADITIVRHTEDGSLSPPMEFSREDFEDWVSGERRRRSHEQISEAMRADAAGRA